MRVGATLMGCAAPFKFRKGSVHARESALLPMNIQQVPNEEAHEHPYKHSCRRARAGR